jgi:hypothetical protein
LVFTQLMRYDSKTCIILDKKCNCQIHLSSYVGKSKHVFIHHNHMNRGSATYLYFLKYGSYRYESCSKLLQLYISYIQINNVWYMTELMFYIINISSSYLFSLFFFFFFDIYKRWVFLQRHHKLLIMCWKVLFFSMQHDILNNLELL